MSVGTQDRPSSALKLRPSDLIVVMRLWDLGKVEVPLRLRPLRSRRVHRLERDGWVQLSFDWPEQSAQLPRRNRSQVAPGRWFEIQCLLDYVECRLDIDRRPHLRREVAEMIGMTQRNLRRRIAVGVIDGDTADRWAIACGVEPVFVWSDWYDDLEGFDDGGVCEVCGCVLEDLFCCLEAA